MMEVLERLSTADLSTLAGAIRSGRLAAPFLEVAVRRYCGAGIAGAVAAAFSAAATDGMQDRHLAQLLEAVSKARAAHPPTTDVVELVWSGPEARGVTNRDTGVVVRELFGSATSEVLVAGFAVHQGREVFRRLAERMDEVPALRVRFFLDVRRPHGDTTASSELVWKFLTRFRTSEWPGKKVPELFYDPRSLDESREKRSSLHAKCVVVDRRIAFVTSANFTEAAQSRNIEVGALVRAAKYAEELVRQFDTLQDEKLLIPFPGANGAGGVL